MTFKDIERDGFQIHAKVDISLLSDTEGGITRSLGFGVIGFSDYFEANRPDMLVLLGDRYELFAAAIAAAMTRIPIAHIHGGETTQGATDEFIRHAITKMSHLHFVSTEIYRKRVVQLGEDPRRVYNVGAIGIDNIVGQQLLSRSSLSEAVGISLDRPFAVVTFHPVTLESGSARRQFEELLNALDEEKDLGLLITKANADAGSQIINEMIDNYATRNKDRVRAFANLGQLRYLSAIKHCCITVGNSSSGIIEAPNF